MTINCKVKIISKKTIDELPDAWSTSDYAKILDDLGFSNKDLSDNDIKEMAMMSLADQEPEESATLLLNYRLGEVLIEGQIQSISHEMQTDKISEEYPDIALHEDLFNINQLLYKSFNGKFPNAHAIKVNLNIQSDAFRDHVDEDNISTFIIQALAPALGEHSGIVRLYATELTGKKEFSSAEHIIWKIKRTKEAEDIYALEIYSSEYWLHDLPNTAEYETKFMFFDEVDE